MADWMELVDEVHRFVRDTNEALVVFETRLLEKIDQAKADHILKELQTLSQRMGALEARFPEPDPDEDMVSVKTR